MMARAEAAISASDRLLELVGRLEQHDGFSQVVTVRPCDFTMAWQLPDSSLRNFMFDPGGGSGPSARELHRLNEFCLYELAHGRRVPIWFEDSYVGDVIVQSIARFFSAAGTDLDEFVTEAMASQHVRTAKFPPQERVSKWLICHSDVPTILS